MKGTRVKIIKGLIGLNERFVFEKRLRRSLRGLLGKPAKLVLDVGANKGQTIEFFLRMDPSCVIHAFEPNKKLIEGLRAKYGANKNIHLHEMGVSDYRGEKTFNENLLDYTSTFEELNMDSDYLQKKSKVLGVDPSDIVTARYQVQTTTLSEFIQAYVTDTIDVIKIDVEGHEHACLNGLFAGGSNVPVRFLQLESHNDDMYANKTSPEQINDLLVANGFELKAKVKHGFGDLDELIYANTKLT